MEAKQIAQAAALFVEARRGGALVNDLPAECKPTTVAETNAIIDEVTRQMGEPIAGWKITFLYKPRQKPFRCPLVPSRLFSSPARIPAKLTPSLFVEPEITFRLRHDLPPRAKLYRAEEVAEAVDACPSFEIVDSRFDTRNRSIRQRMNENLMEAYADHIVSGAFVIGEPYRDWRDIDFAAMRVAMKADGETVVETIGGHAFIDPFLPVVVLANEMRHSTGLKAGYVVATGSFCGFFPMKMGQAITAEFEHIGKVAATFV